MIPRYCVKFLGGKNKVDDLIRIASSNYGRELGEATRQISAPGDWGIRPPDGPDSSNPCYSCEQQAGSNFLRRLNRGDDTPGPGSFTQIPGTTRRSSHILAAS
jgi:hypothetical protein